MLQKKIIGDVDFALQKRKLRKGEHYTIEAKIGGGKKEAHITFADEKYLEDNQDHLEELAQRNEFTVVLKAA